LSFLRFDADGSTNPLNRFANQRQSDASAFETFGMNAGEKIPDFLEVFLRDSDPVIFHPDSDTPVEGFGSQLNAEFALGMSELESIGQEIRQGLCE
jgi:hypothetical protein